LGEAARRVKPKGRAGLESAAGCAHLERAGRAPLAVVISGDLRCRTASSHLDAGRL